MRALALEHLPVGRRCGNREIGFSTRERQFERPSPLERFAFFRGWRTQVRFLTLRFRLLKFDVLALESSGHGSRTPVVVGVLLKIVC